MLNLFSLKDPVLLLFAWYSRPRKQSLPHMPYIPYLFIRYVASQARRFKGTAQQIRSDSGRGEGVDSGKTPLLIHVLFFVLPAFQRDLLQLSSNRCHTGNGIQNSKEKLGESVGFRCPGRALARRTLANS